MKRKLLFAMLCIVGALNVSAQQDVTATYLTNADFSTGTAVSSTVSLTGSESIDGWTIAGSSSDAAGALFAYGGTAGLGSDDTPAPTSSPSSGLNAAGLCAMNGATICYTQDVTLEAGCYTVTFDVYNSSYNYSSGKIIGTNLFGFAVDGGAAYYAPNNTFAISQWTTVAVTFELTSDTSGKISMGYIASTRDKSNAIENMPHLFVDNVKIFKQSFCNNVTSKVGIAQGDWTGASEMPGNDVTTDDGRTTHMAAVYNKAAAGNIMYQDVKDLDNGTYEVVVYAYSQMEWKDQNTWLMHDAGDVGYVYAGDVKTWINARRGPGFPADGPGIYTISGVKVTDGTLRIGFDLAISDQTEWHAIQIKSLIYTNGLSLADYEASVKEWKDKIRAITALPPKYLENTNALLSVIYDTYSTVEEYEYVIQTLSDLYDQAKIMEGLYAQYTNLHNYVTALLAVPYVEKVDGAHAALEAANVEPEIQYQQDAYNAIYDLNHAAWVYVRDADPAVDNQFDITFFLENPDVTKFWDGTWGIRPDGWNTDQTTEGQNFQVMQNDRMGPGGEIFMEYWSGSPAQEGFVLYQQVNLPAGTYKMSGRVAANFDNQGGTVQNVFFAANDAVGTQITSETLMDAEVEFVQDSEDIVKIGMIATSGNQARWMGINGIHLYKVAEKSFRINEWEDYDYTQSGAGDVYLLRNLEPNTYNTMVLPFSMTAEEIEQAFGMGTHVYLAEKFVDNNISLRTPDYDTDGVGVEKIMPNVPFIILPTLVDCGYSPNGIQIPARTIVESETVNPQYNGDKVTLIGNYASAYQVPQVGMVNWVIAHKYLEKPQVKYKATGADGTYGDDDPVNPVETRLYYVNSDVTIATTYCYFALEGATEAKAIGFDVEGEATGIAVVDDGDVKFYSGKAYDLSGREVKNPGKGLYIIGGKKVMIK